MAPPPPPTPEGGCAPPPSYVAPSTAPRPSWGRWLAVGTVVATILAAGGGIGIGFTLSQYLRSSHATQNAALPPTSEPSTSTAPLSPVNHSPHHKRAPHAHAIPAKGDPPSVDLTNRI